MPKKYVQIPTIPKRIVAINEMISKRPDDPRRKFIQATPFRGLLYVQPATIYSDVIIHLLSKWDVERQCFILRGGQRWEISDDAVARVYGLPYGETKENIQLDWKDDEYEFANTFLQGQGIPQGVPEGKGNLVLGSDIYETLYRPDLVEDANACDFWRLYVLYALCYLLVPNSFPAVNGRYLRFLQTPHIAARYNWAALVRDILQKGINDFANRKSRSARPNGDLYCLVNMFMDMLNRPRSALRGFTCAINSKKLTLEDVKEAFPDHDEEHHDLVSMDIPPPILTGKQKKRFLLERIERLQEELLKLENSPISSEEEEDADVDRPKRRAITGRPKRKAKTDRPKRRAKTDRPKRRGKTGRPKKRAKTDKSNEAQLTAIQASVHDGLPLQALPHEEVVPSAMADEEVAPLCPIELPPQTTNHLEAPSQKIDERVVPPHQDQPNEEPHQDHPNEEPHQDHPNEEPHQDPHQHHLNEEPHQDHPNEEPHQDPHQHDPNEEPHQDHPNEEPHRDHPNEEPHQYQPNEEPHQGQSNEEPHNAIKENHTSSMTTADEPQMMKTEAVATVDDKQESSGLKEVAEK